MPRASDPSARSFDAPLSVTDTLPIMFHVTDVTGAITQVSDMWLKTLGYERDDVLGQSISDFMTPESKAKALADPRSFLQKGNFEELNYELQIKDGTSIPCKLNRPLFAGVNRPGFTGDY